MKRNNSRQKKSPSSSRAGSPSAASKVANGAQAGWSSGSTAATLLGAVAAAVAIMYLFDPDSGKKRRGAISSYGTQVLSGVGDSLGHLVQGAANGTSAAAATVANEFGGRIGNIFDGAKSATSRAAESARDSAGRAIRNVGDHIPHNDEHHYVGQATCALSSMALGAGIVYFFDPTFGADRRSEVSEKFAGGFRDGGHFLSALTRRIADLFSGSSCEEDWAQPVHEHATGASDAGEEKPYGPSSETPGSQPSGSST